MDENDIERHDYEYMMADFASADENIEANEEFCGQIFSGCGECKFCIKRK